PASSLSQTINGLLTHPPTTGYTSGRYTSCFDTTDARAVRPYSGLLVLSFYNGRTDGLRPSRAFL
ncbi:hypothetical protein, partial [Porphyromonas sp.]|uniref:hypothetical protein n=1 Tax=Porphyromonas sp. TaxID=1924944 RepID=UPI0025F4868D